MDGRRENESRRVTCELGRFAQADGSATYQQGNTKVICAIYGPKEAKLRSQSEHDKCTINCEYTMASFATSSRMTRSKSDRRMKEAALIIKQTFESVILTHLYPRSQISILVQILADDGGAMSAAINAASLALINAGIPMKDFVIGCSVGFINKTALLDLNYFEKGAGCTCVHVAIYPKTKKVALVHMEDKLPLDNLEGMINLASQGCDEIYQTLKQDVKEYSFGVVHTRGFATS